MRVLVTRPAGQAEATARRLAELGLKAVCAPVLEIVPTGAPFPAGPFDLALATSARAFVGTPPANIVEPPLACVGRKTAEAGKALGFSIVLAAADADALLAELAKATRPKSAVYLAGRERKPDLETRLREKGWRISVCETYEARPVSAWPASVLSALKRREIDAILHYSPRSAAIALRLMGRTAAKSLIHCCLSSEVASACQDWAPPDRILVASHPDEESLMTLLRSREADRGDGKA